MKRTIVATMAAAFMASTCGGYAVAKDKIIAVSWGTKQEERWKTDEAAIKGAIEATATNRR